MESKSFSLKLFFLFSSFISTILASCQDPLSLHSSLNRTMSLTLKFLTNNPDRPDEEDEEDIDSGKVYV